MASTAAVGSLVALDITVGADVLGVSAGAVAAQAAHILATRTHTTFRIT
ncbi:MAG: hypothetical protein M1546_16115 [Chloroflexi bacterium]|nr:hypothetical protein [Chloroflexota bacterium]